MNDHAISPAIPPAFDATAPAVEEEWPAGPTLPFLEGSYANALGRPRGHPTFPDEEWDASASEEERFAALKIAVEEGFRDVDAGRYIEICSPEQLREMLRNAGETARSKMPGTAHAAAPYATAV